MKRIASFIFSFALGMSGCDRGEPCHDPDAATSGTESTVATWPATVKTDRGNFQITIEPSEGPIERNQHFSLDVLIESTGENPLKEDGGLGFRLDADMPAHRHGMNTKPETTETGDHQYRVDGMLFHMAGDWAITVEISGESGKEQAVFPVYIE